jgi:hypothetical protein
MQRVDLHIVLLCEHPPGVPSQIGLASGTRTVRGTPDGTAHASGDQLRLAPTGLACVDPRSRLYALPGWGILVIGCGEKTTIARIRAARRSGSATLRAKNVRQCSFNFSLSHPGFGGDLETRISVLERGTPCHAKTDEVPRRAA